MITRLAMIFFGFMLSCPAIVGASQDVVEEFTTRSGVPAQFVFREGEGYFLRMPLSFFEEKQGGETVSKRNIQAKRAANVTMAREVILIVTGKDAGSIQHFVTNQKDGWIEAPLKRVLVDSTPVTAQAIQKHLQAHGE